MPKLNLLCLIVFLAGCHAENSTSSKQEYLRWVGDIEFDPELDDRNFELCHGESNVKQYFNFGQGFQYEGEKKSILEEFSIKYQPIPSDDSGLIRIRFIVNCKGETDRFRVMAMNKQYEEISFDHKITDQLLDLTKSLNGWKVLPDSEAPRDYYQYLIFKIEKGAISEILP
jgi:hypothetical protein